MCFYAAGVEAAVGTNRHRDMTDMTKGQKTERWTQDYKQDHHRETRQAQDWKDNRTSWTQKRHCYDENTKTTESLENNIFRN